MKERGEIWREEREIKREQKRRRSCRAKDIRGKDKIRRERKKERKREGEGDMEGGRDMEGGWG
jgi:hypothetical protein